MSQEVVHRWLIAVEVGARWPAWLADLLAHAGRAVVAQHEGERPTDFAARALGVAAATSGLGGVLLLCNERADPTQSEARRRLLVGLTRGALVRGGRRLVVGPEAASERLRTALVGLASGKARRSASLEICFERPGELMRSFAPRPVARVA